MNILTITTPNSKVLSFIKKDDGFEVTMQYTPGSFNMLGSCVIPSKNVEELINFLIDETHPRYPKT